MRVWHGYVYASVDGVTESQRERDDLFEASWEGGRRQSWGAPPPGFAVTSCALPRSRCHCVNSGVLPAAATWAILVAAPVG